MGAQNSSTASSIGSSTCGKRSSQHGCKAAAANSSRSSSRDEAVIISSTDGEHEEDEQSISDLLALLPASVRGNANNKPRAAKGTLPGDAAVRVVVATPSKAVTSKKGAAAKVELCPAGAAAVTSPKLTDYTAVAKAAVKRAPHSNKTPGEPFTGVGC
jgi:hypothetical protein